MGHFLICSACPNDSGKGLTRNFITIIKCNEKVCVYTNSLHCYYTEIYTVPTNRVYILQIRVYNIWVSNGCLLAHFVI